MLKKVLITLAFFMALGCSGQVMAADLSVAQQSQWRFDALTMEDITYNGDDPFKQLDRYHLAYMVGRTLEKTGAEAGGMVFKDVPEGHWAERAIDIAVSNEVFSYYDDGTFRGDFMVTNMDMARAFARLLKIYGKAQVVENLSVNDVPMDSADYEAVNIVCNKGIMSLDNGSFKGRSPVGGFESRAMMLNFINELKK